MEETLQIVSPDGNHTAIIKINDQGEIIIFCNGNNELINITPKPV